MDLPRKVADFVEAYARRVLAAQPCHGELADIAARPGVDAEALEEAGVVERGAVLCCREGGNCEILFVDGGLFYVDTDEAAEECVARGGRVAAEIHNHPGGAAVPSGSDWETLLRAPWTHTVYSCVARRGCGEAVAVCVEWTGKLQFGEELALESIARRLGAEPRIEVGIVGDLRLGLMGEEEAARVEEEFLAEARRRGLRVHALRIPL